MAGRYQNVPVLVTGGLGFIGSNLVLQLVHEGAIVSVADPSIPGCGANPYNLAPVRERVRVLAVDIADSESLASEIAQSQVIFNLAGEISHIHSMEFPERDMQINAVAQLRFLRECQRRNASARIVYAGTRQVYGVPECLPVDEKHPIAPVDFNGVHKFAAAMYHEMLTRAGQLDAIVLRLTNVYGPRMALDVPCQGFLSTFLRRLLLGQPLEIYGDGRQLRDPVYVDDVVEAFLLAGIAERKPHCVYNVGGPEALSLEAIARAAAEANGGAEIVFRPFPDRVKPIDIGSYCADYSRIQREFGWKPRTRFADGIRLTLAYYGRELAHYLDPANPQPHCKMPEHAGQLKRLTYASGR
jgi:nucleoside-diphosphate-sugar epimerase